MTARTGIAGVILAGGRATRIGGGDKALLPLGGRPMLAHLVTRLAPQVTALALNANGPADRFAAFDLPVLPDTEPGQPGPLAGVLAGMRWAQTRGCTHVFTCAADTPFVPIDVVARLQAGGDFSLATSPDETGTLRLHPTVGLWPVALMSSLQDALTRGERKVGLWASENGAERVAFNQTPDPFFNVNTPDDLAVAEHRITHQPPRFIK